MQLESAERLLRTPIDRVAPHRVPRKVRGLLWAELRDFGPFAGKRLNRNAKACVKRGHSYERQLHRELQRRNLGGQLFFQQWILFADSNGLGWAQPDAYVLWDDLLLLMEAKLTQNKDADAQLLSLYLPLLRRIYQVPILCLQVCKNLRTAPPKLVDGPEDLLSCPGPGVHTWHFLGGSG